MALFDASQLNEAVHILPLWPTGVNLGKIYDHKASICHLAQKAV